jgi:hypothetical protein
MKGTGTFSIDGRSKKRIHIDEGGGKHFPCPSDNYFLVYSTSRGIPPQGVVSLEVELRHMM